MSKEQQLSSLIDKDSVAYKQLDKLYGRCKASLDEFYHEFQTKTEEMNNRDLDSFQNLTNLQTISKEIQALSSRVIELEGKIDSVSKCDKSPKPTAAFLDRKLLPCEVNRGLIKPVAGGSGGYVAKGFPALRTDKLLGGNAEAVPKEHSKHRKARKEVSRSKGGGHRSSADLSPVPLREEETDSRVSATRRNDHQPEVGATTHQNQNHQPSNKAPAPYEKVYKLIPELLSKFEEFHQSFGEACDSGKQIEPAAATDILKVIDEHLKLLESLEMRLSGCRDKSSDPI